MIDWFGVGVAIGGIMALLYFFAYAVSTISFSKGWLFIGWFGQTALFRKPTFLEWCMYKIFNDGIILDKVVRS